MSQDSSATPLPGSVAPDPRLVASALSEAGLSIDAEQLKLLPVFSGSGRRDMAFRRHFRVVGDDDVLCHLVVGSGLRNLWQRATGFAEACPEIACRPIFFHSPADADYLGFEYFDGQDLETLVGSGGLTASEAIDLADRVLAVLDRSRQPSTTSAAMAELESTLSWIAESPLFGGLDQIILNHAIFTYLRTAMIQTSPSTRWTNGDFVARNILVNRRREIRLIDYEFAAETHFCAEDGWRWYKFSQLPEEARHLQSLDGELRSNPGLEVHAILRQMASAQEINGAEAAIDDSRRYARQLIDVLRENTALLRTSVFFRSCEAARPHSVPVKAQLFWSRDSAFTEQDSQSREYPCGIETDVTFSIPAAPGRLRLRLDPADTSGLLSISYVRIRDGSNNRTIHTIDRSSGWEALQPNVNLLAVNCSSALRFLSLNDDPQITLPELSADLAQGPLIIEAGLTLDRNLTDLPHCWPQRP